MPLPASPAPSTPPARPYALAIGEALWDVFPDRERLGGAPLNFAYHLHQLGIETRLLSALGDDAAGRRLHAALQPWGKVGEDLAWSPRPTGSVVVELAGGQPRYHITEGVAWDDLPASPTWRELARGAAILHFSTLAQRAAPSRAVIQELLALAPAEAIRVFDLNLRQNFYTAEVLRDGLARATVLKLNQAELAVLEPLLAIPSHLAWPEKLERLFAHTSARLVALTLDEKGCILATRTERVRAAPPAITLRDAVGAGDAFTAALAAGVANRAPLTQIARAANALGAFVASQPGATPDSPPELRHRLRHLLGFAPDQQPRL